MDKFIDRVLLQMFPLVFLRFADRHLNRAFSCGEINSSTLHILDNRFKYGLGRGYTDPDKAHKAASELRPRPSPATRRINPDWME